MPLVELVQPILGILSRTHRLNAHAVRARDARALPEVILRQDGQVASGLKLDAERGELIDLRGRHRVAQASEQRLVAGHVADTHERGLGAQRSDFVLNRGHDLSADDQQGGAGVDNNLIRQ